MSKENRKTPEETRGRTTPPKVMTNQKTEQMVPTNQKQAGRTAPPKVMPRNTKK